MKNDRVRNFKRLYTKTCEEMRYYKRIQKDKENAMKNISNKEKMKIIFLDKDGVLNSEDYVFGKGKNLMI